MADQKYTKIAELIKNFERLCKSRGLRITHQRSEIFHEMAKYKGHPTVDSIFNRVRKHLKTISLDTVYRTISTFEEYGLIKRIQMLDNSARFDINLSDHHHLICTQCKRIEDFYWPDFDKMRLPSSVKKWPIIDSRHVEILGLCSICLKK